MVLGVGLAVDQRGLDAPLGGEVPPDGLTALPDGPPPAGPPPVGVDDALTALADGDAGLALRQDGAVHLIELSSVRTTGVLAAKTGPLHAGLQRASLSASHRLLFGDGVEPPIDTPPSTSSNLPQEPQQVWSVDLDSGERTVVGPGRWPAVSPDGATLAHLEPTEQCPDAPDRPCELRWDTVAVTDLESGSIHRLRVSDEIPTPLTGVAWSVDGRSLHVARDDPDGARPEPSLPLHPVVYRVDPATRAPIEEADQLLVGDRAAPLTLGVNRPVTWRPIGGVRDRLIVLEEGASSRYPPIGAAELDLETGEVVPVADLGVLAPGGVVLPLPAVAPDGSAIWYPPPPLASPPDDALAEVVAVVR